MLNQSPSWLTSCPNQSRRKLRLRATRPGRDEGFRSKSIIAGMRETAGPYRLLERTGEDRIGETFRAADTARGRTALVRLVHPHIAEDHAKRAALVADAE